MRMSRIPNTEYRMSHLGSTNRCNLWKKLVGRCESEKYEERELPATKVDFRKTIRRLREDAATKTVKRKLQAANYEQRNANCELRTAKCELCKTVKV